MTGPLGGPIEAAWGVWPKNKTALIELAQVCGLAKMPQEKLNPALATTYGVGELMRPAWIGAAAAF